VNFVGLYYTKTFLTLATFTWMKSCTGVLINPYPDLLPFQLFFFSVQGTGGSLTGPNPENRVGGDQDIGNPGRPVSSGLQVPGEPFLPGRAKNLSAPRYKNIFTVDTG
jgi:hypothetical protein